MLHYFLVQDKKFLIIIIGKTFPTKNLDKIPTPEPGPEATGVFFVTPKPTKEQTNKSKSDLYEDFWNQIVNDETNINNEICN